MKKNLKQDKKEREKYVENFLTFMPILHKKLFKGVTQSDITMRQMGFLFFLKNYEGKPMNYYCSQMMISKPNLTVMTDRFIEEGLIERGINEDDRRVITLKLTSKGENILLEHRKMFTSMVLERLKKLDDKEVLRLNELMEEAMMIISKIED